MARGFQRADKDYLGYVGVVASMPFTMACWFKSSDTTNAQCLMAFVNQSGGVNGDWHQLRLAGGAAGDPVHAVSYATAAQTAATSTGYSANTWHHACGIFASATDRRAYIDGGSKGTNTTAQSPVSLSHTSLGWLWRSDNPAPALAGSIAEAAIWDVALTDEEVAALGKGLCPLFVRPQNIVAYWSLIRDDNDRIGVYNLTAGNTPTWTDHPPIFYPAPPRIIHIPAAGPVVGGALQMWPRFF